MSKIVGVMVNGAFAVIGAAVLSGSIRSLIETITEKVSD